MHSCYDAYLMYGVMDNRDRRIDSDWLEEHFPEMETCASEVVRNYMGNPVYGYIWSGSEVNGTFQATIDDESRADVKKLYDMICAYNKAIGETDMPKMGYHFVVSGDYETEHDTYVPEPETESESEDESESESETEFIEVNPQNVDAVRAYLKSL